MSDWQAGDLAMRVSNVRPSVEKRTGLRQGGLYTVSNVVEYQGIQGLQLIGCVFKGRLEAVRASRFVKITPGHKIEGSEVDQKEPWKVE